MRFKIYLAAGFLVLATAAVYSDSLHAPFVFDDIPSIPENPDIRDIKNLKNRLVFSHEQRADAYRTNDPGRPLPYLTLALNYHFGQLNTFGYHLFNLVLHILNVLLVFVLARILVGYLYQKEQFGVPFFAALLFAVHPINAEVVVCSVHRTESLAAFFYLFTLFLFARACEGKRFFYPFALVSFALALFSKQIVVTLPVILVLFDYMVLSGSEWGKVLKNKYLHLPFWILTLFFVLFWKFYIYRNGYTTSEDMSWTTLNYALTQIKVVARYVGMYVVPVGLCVDHRVSPVKTVMDFNIIAAALVIAGLAVGTYFAAKSRKPSGRLVLFSFLWFFVTLFPTSSFFPIRDAMADRRMYLPGIGLCLIVALWGGGLPENLWKSRKVSAPKA